MNSQQMVKPALVAGAVLVALVLAGLPFTYLGFLLLILACPAMMFFMMRGMGGMDHGAGGSHDDVHDHDPARHGRPGER